ncbi:MAG: hypothetical protein RR547_01350 [Raoultibacter sp.]
MAAATPPLRIESLTVQPGRIVCEVVVAMEHCYTTPRIAETILADHPSLARHACVNDIGPTFGSVINQTSLPHLLEHLVIDLQVRSEGKEDETLVGTSEWTDKQAGRATVTVSFTDDLVALRAFRDAAEKITQAVLK